MTHVDSRRKEDVDFLPRDRNCQFCDQTHATGYWMAKVDVLVCSSCAKTVLPALIADAVFLCEGQEIHLANTALTEIEKAYWRAVAGRIAHGRI